MKNLILLIGLYCFCTLSILAQNPKDEILKEYVGTYKLKGDGPFTTYKITFSENNIYGEADEYGANKLVPQSEKDKFQSTSAYASIITFQRNENQKIIGLKMEIQGTTLDADKVLD